MWIALTEQHLLTRMSGKELDKLRAAALAAEQADPVQEVFDQVTRKVRSRVAACTKNRLGPAGTIPDELLGDALALCVVAIMTRPGGIMIDPADQRAKDADGAERNLRDAAACNIAIEQPADADVSTEKVAAPSPSFGERHHRAGRCQEDGV
ncbi:MAG TPA: hypothetical protein VG167_00930 [Verrucomicrobiae bacterium]|nr:hypothetical protein [Verrucomicrobiae bacterium]